MSIKIIRKDAELMQVVIINFSGRLSNGNGSKLTEFINELLNNEAHIINFSTLNVNACNRCDYECLKHEKTCKYINDDIIKIYNTILEGDYIIFIIPVYCDYPCSNYFVFRERAQSFFDEVNYSTYINKITKFIIIANSGYENVVNIIKSDFNCLSSDSIIQLSSEKYNTKSVKGDLLQNDKVKQQITEFIHEI